jgi:hypothetical protein
MSRTSGLGWIGLLLIFSRMLGAQNSADATAIGVAQKADISIGEGYVTSTQSLEAKITLLELLRGEKAWELIKSASPSNKPVASGMEYLAARIRFELAADGPGDLSCAVRDEQFASFRDGGRQYARPAVVPPRPELSGRLYPGDALEGWIVLLVSKEDEKPLMSFGNNYGRVWFKLYYGPADSRGTGNPNLW